MLYGQDRERMRGVFCEAWRKHCGGEPLEPLEARIRDLLLEHPEYHALLDDPQTALATDFPNDPAANPFLHLALHLAVREQLECDRPPGVVAAFAALRERSADPHQAEHRMMECLAGLLWEAQRTGRPPDESAYLAALHALR